jgi:transglutaminase-like putative cysteine protease
MNPRLTLTAAAAVILASVSVYPLIVGASWFWAGVGAVLVVAAAGTLTRLPASRAAVAGCVLVLIACWPLLAGPAWYGKATGVLIVALAAAGLTRLRILPALGCLLTYLAALMIYLNALLAAGRSIAGFVPTTASVHYLWALAGRGFAERAYIPPVPGTPGITLLTAAGIGLMAAATDLLAVRLRSPAIAGLPLLALYSVPITTNAKQGGLGATVVFCLGIIGYLALLAADGRDRLRGWGRLVTVWQHRDRAAIQRPDTRTLAASGRRIGLAAISIAIVLPLLLPGIRVHGLFNGHGTAGSPGGPAVELPDPLVQMQQQLLNTNPQSVLTYSTDTPDPAEQYLQLYVLNYDTGSGQWFLVPPASGSASSLSVGSGSLAPAPGVSSGAPEATYRTQVSLSRGVAGYGSKWSFLPLPYAPADVGVAGDWREDKATLMVYSADTPLSGLTYTVTSKESDAPTQQLEQSSRQIGAAGSAADYLSRPVSQERKLAAIAAQITSGATSPFDKALLLQNWFTTDNRFSYTTSVHLPDTTAGLIEFLTKTRQGYCQQFAFAMAVLARVLGIPSRIAVGYTGGVNQGHGTWKVTTADAHAWPELYFAGYGWLRFEPTPGGAGGQATAVQPAYATTTPASRGPAGQLPGTTGPGSIKASPAGGGSAAGRHKFGPALGGSAASPTSRHGGGAPFGLIALVLLGLALIAPATARILVRRRRWRRAADDDSLAAAAWRELLDDLADHGMACRASESPRAVARRITSVLGLDEESRQALERIASAEERARYATAPQPSGTLRRDVGTVRQAISLEADGGTRWRARLLPSSALAPARSALHYALDVFGWMDAAGQWLRRRSAAGRAGLADKAG